MKKNGNDPEKGIIVPIAWRKHVELADELIERIATDESYYEQRMLIYNGSLNILCAMYETQKLEIMNVIIKQMETAYDNFKAYNGRQDVPKKIIVVCKLGN